MVHAGITAVLARTVSESLKPLFQNFQEHQLSGGGIFGTELPEIPGTSRNPVIDDDVLVPNAFGILGAEIKRQVIGGTPEPGFEAKANSGHDEMPEI